MRLTGQTAFSELRKHLTRATITHCYAFKDQEVDNADMNSDEDRTKMNSADAYKCFIFDEEEFRGGEKEIQDFEGQLDAQVAKFCKDGERWIQCEEISD